MSDQTCAGVWSLEIGAEDGAGNVSPTNLSHVWTVAYQPDLPYASFASAPLGPVPSANNTFQMQV